MIGNSVFYCEANRSPRDPPATWLVALPFVLFSRAAKYFDQMKAVGFTGKTTPVDTGWSDHLRRTCRTMHD